MFQNEIQTILTKNKANLYNSKTKRLILQSIIVLVGKQPRQNTYIFGNNHIPVEARLIKHISLTFSVFCYIFRHCLNHNVPVLTKHIKWEVLLKVDKYSSLGDHPRLKVLKDILRSLSSFISKSVNSSTLVALAFERFYLPRMQMHYCNNYLELFPHRGF